MDYEELKRLVKPEDFFAALKAIINNNNFQNPIPKFDGSSMADTIWPQETFRNKDILGGALIELLCTDKLLSLPSDEDQKDALVITEKGEKVIKYLFEALHYACREDGIDDERIDNIPRPYRYYVSDFFERSLEMDWSTQNSDEGKKYVLSEELCMAFFGYIGDDKNLLMDGDG